MSGPSVSYNAIVTIEVLTLVNDIGTCGWSKCVIQGYSNHRGTHSG